MRGYISIGESVPEVMTTDWNRSKTGLIAIEASLQQNWNSGSCKLQGGVMATVTVTVTVRGLIAIERTELHLGVG